MNNYFNFLILRTIIYFLYWEIKYFFRYFKYLFNLFGYINILKYSIYRKKDYRILKSGPQKQALKKNYYFWKKFIKKNKLSDEILVTSLVSVKSYSINNCIIGLFLSNIFNKNPVGLIKQYDYKTEIFIRSFGINKVHYIPNGNIFSRFKYFFKSVNLISKIKKTDDLLNLKYENIDIGKIVYDHYIRFTGIGSIDLITPKILFFLSKALLIQNFSKQLFKSNSFKEVVQSEQQFIPSALVFQNALVNNCDVFTSIGQGNKISVMIYRDIKTKYKDRHCFSKDLFNLIYKNYKKEISDTTEEILRERFHGNFKYSVVHHIEENMEHKFTAQSNLINNYSKNELCKKFDWDINKPIVIIFATDLTDGVFKVDWKIFKDSLTGLQETLNIIKEIKNINWLIKPHPNDIKNNVITSTEKEVLRLSKIYKNIELFPKNFGNNSLSKIISAAVTMGGSVGYEFPSLGIPSIICTGTFYAGHGFNYEASTVDEYKKMLKKADKLTPLSVEQIAKAKTFIYIYAILTRVYSPLIPEKEVKDKGYEYINFWKDLEKIIENYKFETDDFYKNFKIQLEKFDRHTINYNFIKK